MAGRTASCSNVEGGYPAAIDAHIRHQARIRQDVADDRLLCGLGADLGVGTRRQYGDGAIDAGRPSVAGLELFQGTLCHEQDEHRLRLRACEPPEGTLGHAEVTGALAALTHYAAAMCATDDEAGRNEGRKYQDAVCGLHEILGAGYFLVEAIQRAVSGRIDGLALCGRVPHIAARRGATGGRQDGQGNHRCAGGHEIAFALVHDSSFPRQLKNHC